MTTLATSFLNGSSSFVGNKDFHKSLNEFIFSHTHPPATELAALEHLKYNYIQGSHTTGKTGKVRELDTGRSRP